MDTPRKGQGRSAATIVTVREFPPSAKNPHEVKILIHLLLVSRHLERIADQATNIAEDVIYMIEGIIIRHRAEDYTRHD
jgi:phosphate uptake regulator